MQDLPVGAGHRITVSLLAGMLGLVAAAAPAIADDDYPPLALYGQVRLDLIVDDSTLSDVRAPMWVDPEPGASDGESSVHPRLSRIGLSIDDWTLDHRWAGAGQLEVDFAGGDRDDQAGLRLRHAYVALTRRQELELLIGQTWDLISPLFPSVNAETQMWNAGNTGDRRPQLRLTTFPGEHWRLAVAIGATGAIDGQDVDGDGRLDGSEGGVPTAQALLEHRRRLGGDQLRIGVWGHAAREALASGPEMASSAIGGHLFLPIGRLVLMGELFHGKNLDDIRGGIGQGWNRVRDREIRATGGWVEAALVVTGKHMVAVGESIDRADADDLEDGDRQSNVAGYGVLRYRPQAAVQLGLEYMYWVTTYKQTLMEPTRGTASRVSFHASVTF